MKLSSVLSGIFRMRNRGFGDLLVRGAARIVESNGS
jgi:hypothetical protein